MKNIFMIFFSFSFIFGYNGSIKGLTYFDYTNDLGESSFNLKRQYISYENDMSNHMTFKVVFDVGRTNKLDGEDTRLDVFLKKAYLKHKSKLGTTQIGMIGTNSYGVQEKNWGYRFIEKSALDKNKFSHTADLGVGFSKNILKKLNVSIQITNGEGYKSAQSDRYQKFGVNFTYGEKNLLKKEGFNGGIVFTNEQTIEKPITLFGVFGGFSFNKLRFAVESNYITKQSIIDNLFSLSSTYSINHKVKVFYRYDLLDTNTNDLEYLISGFLFNLNNGVSISPNLRTTNNDDSSEFVYSLNFEFKF